MPDHRDPPTSGSDRRSVADLMLHVLTRFDMISDSTREYDTPHGRIGYRQLSVLYSLRYQLMSSDVSPSNLAAAFHVKPSVITRVLQKLEDNGLIVRRPNEADGRGIHVELTEAGREVSVYVEEVFIDWMLGGIEHLSDAEVDEFRRTLHQLDEIAERLSALRFQRRTLA